MSDVVPAIEPRLHPSIIRVALAGRIVTKANLARRAGIHPNSLNGCESATWSPRWDTLKALCDALADISKERDPAASRETKPALPPETKERAQ